MPKITVHGGPSYPIGLLPETPAEPDSPSSVRPGAKAPKAEWVVYAESLGLNVEGLSKPKIVKAVDTLKL
jgi:hypothetical protein